MQTLLKYILAVVILAVIPLWQWNEYHKHFSEIATIMYDQNFFAKSKELFSTAPFFDANVSKDYFVVSRGLSILIFYLITVCSYFFIKLISLESKIEKLYKISKSDK